MTIKNTALWIFILTGITANLIFQDSLSADAADARELNQAQAPSSGLGQQERDSQTHLAVYPRG